MLLVILCWVDEGRTRILYTVLPKKADKESSYFENVVRGFQSRRASSHDHSRSNS